MATPEPSNPTSLPNSQLTAALIAESEALRNDLDQARELAAEYQRQLASKTNDFGALNRLLQKTMADFTQLQATVVELRQERHHLANEVMRGAAYERQLRLVTEERNRLIRELHDLRKATDSPEWLMQRMLQYREAVLRGRSRGESAVTKAAEPKSKDELKGADARERIDLAFDSPEDLNAISFDS